MSMGPQIQAGRMEAVARRQSLQWSVQMKGRRTALGSVGEDEGWRGREDSAGMEIL